MKKIIISLLAISLILAALCSCTKKKTADDNTPKLTGEVAGKELTQSADKYSAKLVLNEDGTFMLTESKETAFAVSGEETLYLPVSTTVTGNYTVTDEKSVRVEPSTERTAVQSAPDDTKARLLEIYTAALDAGEMTQAQYDEYKAILDGAAREKELPAGTYRYFAVDAEKMTFTEIKN